jgi:hypothetical protein
MDNIKMDFQEMFCGVKWIDLVQGGENWLAFVDAVMNL